MTSPGVRRIEERLPNSQTHQPSGPETEAAEIDSAPTSAAIAEESAAIYPDINEGRPTPEEIAAEAYRIYSGRGGEHGHDLEDWLEAERRVSEVRRTKT